VTGLQSAERLHTAGAKIIPAGLPAALVPKKADYATFAWDSNSLPDLNLADRCAATGERGRELVGVSGFRMSESVLKNKCRSVVTRHGALRAPTEMDEKSIGLRGDFWGE